MFACTRFILQVCASRLAISTCSLLLLCLQSPAQALDDDKGIVFQVKEIDGKKYRVEVEDYVSIVPFRPGRDDMADFAFLYCEHIRMLVTIAPLSPALLGARFDDADAPGIAVIMHFAAPTDTKKVTYRRWTNAVMKDDLGNKYTQIRWASEKLFVNFDGDQIRLDGRKEVVKEMLCFEKPVAKAAVLRIVLPGENLGLSVPIKLEVTTKVLEETEGNLKRSMKKK